MPACLIDDKGEPTGEMEVCVHRLKNKASFQAMFGSLETDLDKLCLTQAQIGKFIKTYWDSKWLHVQHYRTCFLFKVNGRFVVVQIDGDGLHWYLIDDRNPWPPYDFRIVVPKIND